MFVETNFGFRETSFLECTHFLGKQTLVLGKPAFWSVPIFGGQPTLVLGKPTFWSVPIFGGKPTLVLGKPTFWSAPIFLGDEHQKTFCLGGSKNDLGDQNKLLRPSLLSFLVSWSPGPLVFRSAGVLLLLFAGLLVPDVLVSSPGLLVLGLLCLVSWSLVSWSPGLLVSWSPGLLVCWSPGLLSYPKTDPKPNYTHPKPTQNQPTNQP